MMKYIVKDITTVESPAIIIHGVNCLRTMGSGVAKALYEKWPRVKSDYIEFGTMRLGMIHPVPVGQDLWVVNCYTQHKFGTDGDKYANASSLDECLTLAAYFAEMMGIDDIYSPRIGCGLGGLSWQDEVLPIYNKVSDVFKHLNFIICDIS